MYRQIFVPLDGSAVAEQSLPYVRLLAKSLELPVRLLACVAGESHSQEESAEQDRQAAEYLKRAAASLLGGGLEVSTLAVRGDPASRITDEAALADGALLVMTSRGRSGIQRWSLGSVAERVLHSTPRPLMMIRSGGAAPGDEVRLRTAVVPLDGSPLAEQALPHAAALAAALGMSLVLVRVLSPDVGYYLHPDGFGGASRDRAEELEGQAQDYLAQAADRVRGQGVETVEGRVLHGDPSMALLDFVRAIPECLLIMTTHGRSGIGRWIMGSVADRMVRHNEGPVLVVRAIGEGT